MPSEQPARSVAEQLAAEQLAVEARTNRRTALVALRGELDLLTVSKVAEVLDALEPQADGVRHVVLDLRGLTFMDVIGLKELIRQNEFARSNRHNLAVVRGTDYCKDSDPIEYLRLAGYIGRIEWFGGIITCSP